MQKKRQSRRLKGFSRTSGTRRDALAARRDVMAKTLKTQAFREQCNSQCNLRQHAIAFYRKGDVPTMPYAYSLSVSEESFGKTPCDTF